MATFMANKDTIARKWYVIDAAGVPLGKTAAKAAHILNGNIASIIHRMWIAVILW